MYITVLAGGVGGALFLEGLRAYLDESPDTALQDSPLTVIVNTGDDITLHGLRVCPDLDTVMYRLAGVINPQTGWGRREETHTVSEELLEFGEGPDWFTLGDRDMATHIIRTRLLLHGYPLHRVVQTLCERWGLVPPRIRLLPMSDDVVETHIVIDEDGIQKSIHFQEWWARHRARIPARHIVAAGIDHAQPAPGVIEAIRDADIVLLAPSNPVVSIGTILLVPGIREALRECRAPVIGLSPIIGDAPVRGMADACLKAINVQTSAAAVADLYADFLDGWIVDTNDASDEPAHSAAIVEGMNILMTDTAATKEIVSAMIRLGQQISTIGRRQ